MWNSVHSTRQNAPPFNFLLSNPKTNITPAQRKHMRNMRVARVLVITELILCIVFNAAMLYSIHRGQWINILLSAVITINVLAAGRLLMRLQRPHCASALTVYVVWKIIQVVIIAPVLVIFSFVMLEGYMRSWTSRRTAIQVLVIVWLYAIYSLFLVIYLGRMARKLWKQKIRKRRDSANSAISFISRSFDPIERTSMTSHSQPLVMTTPT